MRGVNVRPRWPLARRAKWPFILISRRESVAIDPPAFVVQSAGMEIQDAYAEITTVNYFCHICLMD